MQGTIRHHYLQGHTECEVVVASDVRLAVPRHLHTSLCLGVQQAGARRLRLRGRELIVCAGQILLICPGEPHACETLSPAGESYSMLSLPLTRLDRAGFPGDEHRSALTNLEPVFFDRAVHGRLCAFFACVLRSHTRLEAESGLMDVLTALGDCAGAGPSPRRSAEPGCAGREVRQAQAYLGVHFREEIALSDLSAAACLSPHHLARRFSREIGIPPHTYQILLRLREARRLLQAGASLADAAQSSGFCDQAHFTHAFRKYNGAPPGLFLRCDRRP